MKPLFRITLGSVSKYGIYLAKTNYKLLKKNYPEADIVFCCNNSSENIVNKFSCDIIYQQNYINSISCQPFKESWKLYPPRLRLNSHEIVLDNDILLLKRIPEIDEFLKSEKALLLNAQRRVYGSFCDLVKKDLNINSGIYGMPPNYDFKLEIEALLKKIPKKLFDVWCDDQGIVAGCLQQIPHIIIKSVKNCRPEEEIRTSVLNDYGFHLIGANRNMSDHNFSQILQSMLK